MTADMAGLDGLIERLRDPMPPHHGKCLKAANQLQSLAERVKVLEAENERLRGVVEFYAGWGIVGPHYDDQVHLDSGDLARAALKGTEG